MDLRLMALFEEWFAEAGQSEINDPNAVFLSTVDETGMPNVRVVLMKGFDETGFIIYSNLESTKGIELKFTPHAALCFDWKSLDRRVIVRGPVETVANEEADAYFQSRPRQSRLGAWASVQSRPLSSKSQLLKRSARFALEFGVGAIPRPLHWTGIRVQPKFMQFWSGGRLVEI